MENLDEVIGVLKDFEEGRVEDAQSLGEKLLEDDPSNEILLLLLANCALIRDCPDDAIDYLERSVEAKPDFKDAQMKLGEVYLAMGQAKDSLGCFRAVLGMGPPDVECLVSLGDALTRMSAFDEAESTLKLALKLDPKQAFAHVLLGRIARNRDMGVDEAIGHCLKAIEVDSRNGAAYNEMGNYLMRAGDAKAACQCFRTLIDTTGAHSSPAFSNWVLSSQYRDDLSPEELFQRHLAFQAKHGLPNVNDPLSFKNKPDEDRRLRVGFVSGDLFAHSVFFFINALFSGFDRENFEFIFFSDRAKGSEDANSRILRQLGNGWVRIYKLNASTVVEKIIKEEIDILVDLAGHSGNNRMMVFSQRAAPVQLTWLGYPGTTGLSNMDYRIVDSITDPAPEADAQASEELYRLPDSFICYKAPEEWFGVESKVEVNPDKIVFGTFNEAPKYSSRVVALWCEILRRLPSAELVFKCRPFGEEKSKEFMMDNLRKHGIDEKRVRLLAFIYSNTGHLGTYNEMDIALDPFPYNGTTTSFEAFWMGVPMITREGDRHCARVGMSLLKNLGLEELIATSDEDYIEKAVALASDPERLLEIKLGLRERMLNSPLCDYKVYGRNFCDALRKMWVKWCRLKKQSVD